MACSSGLLLVYVVNVLLLRLSFGREMSNLAPAFDELLLESGLILSELGDDFGQVCLNHCKLCSILALLCELYRL
jgi:hypothetical protein